MTIKQIIKLVVEAKKPEDVFGVLDGTRDQRMDLMSEAFQSYAFVLHPDRPHKTPAERAAATDAMALLTQLRREAKERIKDGSYGKAPKVTAVSIKSANLYINVAPLAKGDICDIYSGEYEAGGVIRKAAIKIARDTKDADLLAAEARSLKALWSSTDSGKTLFTRYLPRLIESTKLTTKQKPSNILTYHKGTHSLAEVITAYPNGVDVRDMAWMFRRLLEILTWVHRHGIVHGAVLPTNILIRPENHQCKLIDWCYSTNYEKKEKIKAYVTTHGTFYPPEVIAKHAATPATDIFMAANCMIALVGGRRKMVPPSLGAIFDACLIPKQSARYQDAWELYTDFSQVLQRLYGEPKFRDFKMT